jgi:hypothetical protein
VLLDAFLGEVTIHSVESPRARKHSYLDTKELEPFVDPEAIAPRVEALLDITLDEGRELLLTKFREGLTARRAGRDPRDSFRDLPG